MQRIKKIILLSTLIFLLAHAPEVESNGYISATVRSTMEKALIKGPDKILPKSTTELLLNKVLPGAAGIAGMGYRRSKGDINLREDILSAESAVIFFELMSIEGKPTWKEPVTFHELLDITIAGALDILTEVDLNSSQGKYDDENLMIAYLSILKTIGSLPEFIRGRAFENLEIGLAENYFEVVYMVALTLKHLVERAQERFWLNDLYRNAVKGNLFVLETGLNFKKGIVELLTEFEQLFKYVTTRVLRDEDYGYYPMEIGETARIIRELAFIFGIEEHVGLVCLESKSSNAKHWRRRF